MNEWLHDGTIDRELTKMQESATAAEKDVQLARTRWHTAQDEHLASIRVYEAATGIDRQHAESRLIIAERTMHEIGVALETAKQRAANVKDVHTKRTGQVRTLRGLDERITTAHDHLHAVLPTSQPSRGYETARLAEEVGGHHEALERLSRALGVGAPDTYRIENELRPIEREVKRLYERVAPARVAA